MLNKKLNVLVYDVETAPLLGYCWSLWENNIALNQLKSDFFILSWSAKWLEGEDGTIYGPHNKVMYMDQRNSKNIENDKEILIGIWKLLNSADVCITQNGVAFDSKKLAARFLLNGMKPPNPVRNIDTLKIMKKNFALTSNKLEYITKKLCKQHKLDHKKFSGFELWAQCLKGNKDAFKEMERYNKMDVLSLEELYVEHLQKWDNTINFSVYDDSEVSRCICGSGKFQKRGFNYTSTGKFQRFQCVDCSAWFSSKANLLSPQKKKSMLKRI